MPLSPLMLLLLALAPAPPDADIVVTGHPVPPFISPMGEPFRGPVGGEAAFRLWFWQADSNRDAYLSFAEFRADAERFFAKLDLNGDSQIDPTEIVRYEWELAPEIQVNSKLKRARSQSSPESAPSSSGQGTSSGRSGGDHEQAYDPESLQGAARYALINMPEPVAAADADFNRAISLGEFRQAAIDRFALLDTRRSGRLGFQDLKAMLPRLSGTEKRPKRDRNRPDPRVGTPLPPGS